MSIAALPMAMTAIAESPVASVGNGLARNRRVVAKPDQNTTAEAR